MSHRHGRACVCWTGLPLSRRSQLYNRRLKGHGVGQLGHYLRRLVSLRLVGRRCGHHDRRPHAIRSLNFVSCACVKSVTLLPFPHVSTPDGQSGVLWAVVVGARPLSAKESKSARNMAAAAILSFLRVVDLPRVWRVCGYIRSKMHYSHSILLRPLDWPCVQKANAGQCTNRQQGCKVWK